MSAPAWTDAEVRRALGLREEEAVEGLEFTGVSTDSRSVGRGALFVALVGEHLDGHDFVADAVAAGARGAVVSRPPAGSDITTLYPVDDTLVALGRLASHRRAELGATVVGITGSSGKTSTKELTAAAVGGGRRVHATRGNFNNRIGLPLTILAAPADAEVLVLEMGTNEPGEIGTLTAVAGPEVGVVTTVAESHLEKLGSLEGVLEEKLALLRGLPDEGTAVVGDEPGTLVRAARAVRAGKGELRVVGWSDRADPEWRPEEMEADARGRHAFTSRGVRVSLRIPGRHAVQNALLALATADAVGVSVEAAAEGLSVVDPAGLRGEMRRVGGLTLLLDCYNANPQSVAAAVDLLESFDAAGRRVAFLGTMLELGERSRELHRRVLADVLGSDLDVVVASGEFAPAAGEVAGGVGVELLSAREPKAAYGLLMSRLRGDEVVLLKASRGVELERLVPLFEKDFGGDEPREEG